MLTELSIRNFAIIDEISITFDDGLTVLTGETGAGKSIIIDALQLLAGGRGSVQFVRHGAKKAELEALFIIEHKKHKALKIAEQFGINISDNMLILHRTITAKGKSICRVNGKLVTLAILREIGKTLIDIHSQHETQSLMDKENHIQLLDFYAFEEIKSTKLQYRELYKKYRGLKKKIEKFTTDEQELSHRLDLLIFQKKEIEDAQLEPNEDEMLEKERRQLANFEKIYLSLQEAYNSLYGEHKGLDWLNQARLSLENYKKHDPFLEEKSKQLNDAYFVIEELTYELRDFRDELHFDEQRLNEIESRLDEINRLKRKYGPTVNAILEYLAKIDEEIEQISNKDNHIHELEKQLQEIKQDAYLEAKQLHDVRKKYAKKLKKEILEELKDLYLENANFDIHFDSFITDNLSQASLHENGIDQLHFLISTNKGEPLKDLTQVASGGELSRIMLALKKIFSKHQGVTSVIFDEVDTGVSGRVAQAMAEKIYHISLDSQVLCITHLPQVAAMADSHKFIEKIEKQKRVSTTVTDLLENQQIEELSRMITGTKLTETALEHGRELLSLANYYKDQVSNQIKSSS